MANSKTVSRYRMVATYVAFILYLVPHFYLLEILERHLGETGLVLATVLAMAVFSKPIVWVIDYYNTPRQ